MQKMRCKITILALAALTGAMDCAQSSGALSPSDMWRIRNGWPARDGTERERWAANGYGPNGERLADKTGQSPRSSNAGSSLQGEQTFLSAAYGRIDYEKGQLSVLLQKAQYASELVDLIAKYPYGFLDPSIQKMNSEKMQQLFEANRVLPIGVSNEEVSAKEAKAVQQVNDLALQISESENRLQSLSGTRSSTSRDRASSDQRRKRDMPSSVFAGWDANGQPITGTHTGGGNYFMGWDERGQPINRQATDMGRGGIFLGFDENGQPITGH